MMIGFWIQQYLQHWMACGAHTLWIDFLAITMHKYIILIHVLQAQEWKQQMPLQSTGAGRTIGGAPRLYWYLECKGMPSYAEHLVLLWSLAGSQPHIGHCCALMVAILHLPVIPGLFKPGKSESVLFESNFPNTAVFALQILVVSRASTIYAWTN